MRKAVLEEAGWSEEMEGAYKPSSTMLNSQRGNCGQENDMSETLKSCKEGKRVRDQTAILHMNAISAATM